MFELLVMTWSLMLRDEPLKESDVAKIFWMHKMWLYFQFHITPSSQCSKNKVQLLTYLSLLDCSVSETIFCDQGFHSIWMLQLSRNTVSIIIFNLFYRVHFSLS